MGHYNEGRINGHKNAFTNFCDLARSSSWLISLSADPLHSKRTYLLELNLIKRWIPSGRRFEGLGNKDRELWLNTTFNLFFRENSLESFKPIGFMDIVTCTGDLTLVLALRCLTVSMLGLDFIINGMVNHNLIYNKKNLNLTNLFFWKHK